MNQNEVNKDELTYESALAQLQKLVEKIESPSTPLSKVEADLQKALELLTFCKGKLEVYKAQYNEVINSVKID